MLYPSAVPSYNTCTGPVHAGCFQRRGGQHAAALLHTRAAYLCHAAQPGLDQLGFVSRQARLCARVEAAP
eukprot:7780602-Ditylum_brightwellii.AAC.1